MHVDATPKRMPSKVKEEHLPEEHLCSAEAHFHEGLRKFQLLHDEHGNPQKEKFRWGKEQVLEGMLRLGEAFGEWKGRPGVRGSEKGRFMFPLFRYRILFANCDFWGVLWERPLGSGRNVREWGEGL